MYVLKKSFFKKSKHQAKAADSKISQGNYQILAYMVLSFISSVILCSLRKHPFLLALCRWGHFTRRNVCDSVAEIPY